MVVAYLTETVRILSGDELDGVAGGKENSVFKWTGPINNPFETSTPGHRPVKHRHNKKPTVSSKWEATI